MVIFQHLHPYIQVIIYGTIIDVFDVFYIVCSNYVIIIISLGKLATLKVCRFMLVLTPLVD